MAAAPYLRILTVNIYVRDRERSIEFYRDRLGFNLLSDAARESTTHWLAVAPPDGTAILTLVAPPADSDEYKFIGRSGQVVFVTEDVPAKFQEWSARGVPFHHPPQTRPWGGLFTAFEDPDGNSFTLVSHDRVSRQVEAQRRVAQEREFAKQVQARLFPQTLPPLATLDYAGVCVQASQVGGDYYDFLELGPDRLGIVIGDVAGKGMAAALLMANLQASLRGRSAIAADQPRRFLESVNQLFFENPSIAPTPRCSLPNIMTARGSCATPIADTSPAFSSAPATLSNGSILTAPSSDCSKNGTAPSTSASSFRETPSPSTPTA
jgi:catechol 2,3-dioxygenase-like lactoylglutathione lyase family enzyme